MERMWNGLIYSVKLGLELAILSKLVERSDYLAFLLRG